MEYTVGAKVLDGWEIVRPIGAGSFGRVYEVHKTSYNVETVSALKVMSIPESQSEVRSALSDGMDERSVTTYFKGFVDEILHEIAIMSTVKSHPNVVTYEDHHLQEYPNEIRWDILIRMELLTPIDQYQHQLAQTEALPAGLMMPLNEIVRLGRELSSALAFCNQKNIIHRDVKPENIFISDAGYFKLGDFGVAKTAASRSTGGSRKGTERYMAPEVYLNQPYGPTVDIYSLGLVLYRLLNGGRLPFLPPAPQPLTFSDHENALQRRMRGEPIPAPAMADEWLSSIILKACAFRSADRWRSAGELLTALQEYDPSRPAPEPEPSKLPPIIEFYPAPMPPTDKPDSDPPQPAPAPQPEPEPAPEPEPEPAPAGGGTVGGWQPAPEPEPEPEPEPAGGGTVGGWQPAPQPEPTPEPEPAGGGTVGGGWRESEKRFKEAVQSAPKPPEPPQKTPPTRQQMLRFWKERMALIQLRTMPFLYFAPEIPRDLLAAAMDYAGDRTPPDKVLALLSVRNKPKGSLFETAITFGAKFWGIYLTETGFALLGKKKSDAVTNIITARYDEILDAKVTRDQSLGVHRLKLLLKGDRIAMFSPDLAGDHYNYEALCNALLDAAAMF